MSIPAEREKELTKLTASYLNTLSAGAIAVGVYTPFTKLADPAFAATAGWTFIVSSVGYLIFGGGLHVVGRVITDLRFDYDAA